jgi:hypothetical protein
MPFLCAASRSIGRHRTDRARVALGRNRIRVFQIPHPVRRDKGVAMARPEQSPSRRRADRDCFRGAIVSRPTAANGNVSTPARFLAGITARLGCGQYRETRTRSVVIVPTVMVTVPIPVMIPVVVPVVIGLLHTFAVTATVMPLGLQYGRGDRTRRYAKPHQCSCHRAHYKPAHFLCSFNVSRDSPLNVAKPRAARRQPSGLLVKF